MEKTLFCPNCKKFSSYHIKVEEEMYPVKGTPIMIIAEVCIATAAAIRYGTMKPTKEIYRWLLKNTESFRERYFWHETTRSCAN